MIERAMKHTKSNMAAARFLGCSYPHYKQYAKLYKNEEDQTLFDAHLNRQGRGISKNLYKKQDLTPIMDILEGRVDIANYSPKDIKERLIHESLVAEECHSCGFNERRVVDYKVPLILNFSDNNAKNWKLENLEMLCYNCYYLLIGDVFTPEQVDKIESFTTNKYNVAEPDFQLSEDQIENMKALGIL